MNMVIFPDNLSESIFFYFDQASIPTGKFSVHVHCSLFTVFHFPITSIGTVIVLGGMHASLSQA